MKRLLSTGILIVILAVFSISLAGDKENESQTGFISGQVIVKGKGPMTGGMVNFFKEHSGPPPSATKYWRVPTHSFRTDDNGRFEAELRAGKYYMGATQKFSGEWLGPPKDGDYFFISSDADGNPKLHEVRQFKNLDMGVIEEAEPFNSESLVTDGVTSIKGKIIDRQGKAVEGMLVFGFPTSIMFGRPMFVSERTGKDGQFLLRVAGGGKYYLKARANYGGPPTADQVMGVYDRGTAIEINTGEVKKGIDISVSTMGVPE